MDLLQIFSSSFHHVYPDGSSTHAADRARKSPDTAASHRLIISLCLTCYRVFKYEVRGVINSRGI
jgi:hypothetical protein